MSFKADPLVQSIVRTLAGPIATRNEKDELDSMIAALCIVAAEQRWHCLMQICVPLLIELPEELREGVPDIDDERLIQLLVFGHRINEAMHLKTHGREAVIDRLRGLRLPARRWNLPGTDRWVSVETVRELLSDIRDKTRRLPAWCRHTYATRALRKRSAALNARMLDATDIGLLRHMMATGRQWIRLTKPSEHDAIHIRIHYASGFLSVALRSCGIAETKRTILPLLIGKMLSDEERPHIDRHFALSRLSFITFNLLQGLRYNAPIDQVLPLLQLLYGWLLEGLLSRPAVQARIAEMGGHPTLVVTAHGELAQLPFAALHDGERYLVERFNVVQASPLFAEGDFQEGEIDYETLIGGTPMQSPMLRVLAGGKGLSEIEQELADLRALEAEGSLTVEIGPMEPDTPWTSETVRWLLASEGAAMLSAHMESSASNAAHTVIVTPDDRRISVEDILSIPVRAKLVILSGCVSAGYTDWLAPGENSVVSLLRRGGADAVISTLWPIRDHAARLYNVSFATALAKGLSRANAHGTAQRVVMEYRSTEASTNSSQRLARPRKTTSDDLERPADVTMAHPGYWAAFILTGSWR